MGKRAIHANRLINRRAVRPGRLIVLGFFAVILVGMLLLHLPIAAKGGRCTSYVDCLFTSAAATCVTGLAVLDTWQHWTMFGRIVILCQIQIGGLGVMAVVAMMSFLSRRTITMRERLEMSASLSVDDIAGIVRLTRRVLLSTLAVEGVGAVLLAVRFVPQFGWKDGIEQSIFHAISAFCNAGFDLMGEREAFSSLTTCLTDPLVNIVIMVLVVMGGLGFIVWRDLAVNRRWSQLTVHTRLVVVTSAVLLAAGSVLFFCLEYNNPETMAGLSLPQRIMASFFESVTCRSAGFGTVDQGKLTGPSAMVAMILMFIGGSPGSTAGGIKTTSAAMLVLSTWHVLHGKRDIIIFHRRIDNRAVLNALALVMVGAVMIFSGVLILCAGDHVPLGHALFETVAAFSTVSKLWLVLEMYLGRVGVLTLGIAVLRRRVAEPKVTYPEGRIIVG